MRKKLLVIGAGLLQAFVIRKARELGYYTLAVDKNPNATGFRFADEYQVVDIVDQDACLKFAKEKEIDGVMTAATDYGVLSASYVAQQLNLPGLNYEIAKIIKNKHSVRRVLFEQNVDSISQYYEIGDIKEISRIIESIQFPVMVKPCDGSGSKAATRVDRIADLSEACEQAIRASLIGKALIEDFIKGKEYGVEIFVYRGEVFVLGVMEKYMTNPPDYAELGHSMRSCPEIESIVKDVAIGAVVALGVDFGAVNMDVLVSEDNRVYVVDIGARMGGNLIGSHIIPLGTGVDYLGNLIRASTGDPIDLSKKRAPLNVATRILALRPGEIIDMPDIDKIGAQYQVDVYHNLVIGKRIHEYHNNLDGCGYIVATSVCKENAIERAENAKKLIDEGIKRL